MKIFFKKFKILSFKRHRQKFHEKYKLITCQKWIHLELKLSRSARTFQSVNITLAARYVLDTKR